MSRFGAVVVAFALSAGLGALGHVALAQAPDAEGGEPPAPRYALVIGNNAYETLPPLENARGDAERIAAALRTIGFTVFEHTDVGVIELDDALYEFENALFEASAPPLVAVYYAGHGVEFGGANYLIPVDANITAEEQLQTQAMSANDMMDRLLAPEAQVRFIVFDACRDNPLPAEVERSGGDGLARMDRAEPNIFIGYATSPGEVALDGVADTHSPYTQAILENLGSPGVSAEVTFRNIRYDVVNITNRRQVPWDSSSLVEEICFAGCEVSYRGVDEEEKALRFAARHDAPQPFLAYLAQFPQGRFVEKVENILAASAAKRNLPEATPWSDFSDEDWSVVPWRTLLETAVEVVSVEQLQAAADSGDADAATLIGSAYQHGAKVERDLDRALSYFIRACEGGNHRGCSNVGWLLWSREDGATKDAEAAEYLESACLNGDIAAACSNLGVVYATGRGRDEDRRSAFLYYQRGCEAGNALACSNLAFLYLDGDPFPPDPTEAVALMGSSCEGGSMTGCANKAEFLIARVDPNDDRSDDDINAEAVALASRACDRENPAGCLSLALMRLGGLVEPEPDLAQIEEMLRGVCQQRADLEARERACEELDYLD